MKLLYCINGVFNSGGMERVLMQKTNHFIELGYQVVIVTTEQKGRPCYFQFSDKICFYDLGINYQDDICKKFVHREVLKMWKKYKHRKALSGIVKKERPDVCISMFDMDVEFLWSIKDKCKKILEFHFSRNFKLISSKNKWMYFFQKLRLVFWKKIISKYDRFIVLTEEDKKAWGNMSNIEVIPNFIPIIPSAKSDLTQKVVISVGRLCEQKGFDYLIRSWSIVHDSYPEWKLYIWGEGEKRTELEYLIDKYNLSKVVFLKGLTKSISSEYLKSSIYAMTSRYEGLPMVSLEAMSYGLPVVSFECPCGPKDLIKDSFGKLIPNGNIDLFAASLMFYISNIDKRKEAGVAASKEALKYEKSELMKKWIDMLDALLEK